MGLNDLRTLTSSEVMCEVMYCTHLTLPDPVRHLTAAETCVCVCVCVCVWPPYKTKASISSETRVKRRRRRRRKDERTSSGGQNR